MDTPFSVEVLGTSRAEHTPSTVLLVKVTDATGVVFSTPGPFEIRVRDSSGAVSGYFFGGRGGSNEATRLARHLLDTFPALDEAVNRPPTIEDWDSFVLFQRVELGVGDGE